MSRYVLHVTRDCNMNCLYCYEKDKTSGNVSYQELKQNISFIFNNINVESIEFLGGEPFLNIEAIDWACDYIKCNYSNKVKFIISTNCTVYSDEIVSILNKHNIQIGLSIDGTKFMHNCCRHFKNGKGTHDYVMTIAKKLQEQLIRKPMVHITCHKYNIGYLAEGVKYLYDNGFSHVDIGTVLDKHWINDDFFDQYIDQHKKIIQMFDDLKGLLLTPAMIKQNNHQFSLNTSLITKGNSSFVDTYIDVNFEQLPSDVKKAKLAMLEVKDIFKNKSSPL